MRKINTDHTYEYNDVTGYVTNCFGDDMRGTDDHIDELNLLMGEIRALTEQRDRLAEVLLKCRKFMNEESVTLPFCVIDEALATVGIVIPRRRGRRER